jgi:hypothetical protein
VLLSREISVPLRNILKSPSLLCFACTGGLVPGLTGSKAILAGQRLKGKTRSYSASATSKDSLVPDL